MTLMTREQVREWASRESESKILMLYEHLDEFEHVVNCLYHIILWYERKRPLGDFLTAVLKNDLMEACGRADDTNRKVLSLYVKFIYNNLPGDYRGRIRK